MNNRKQYTTFAIALKCTIGKPRTEAIAYLSSEAMLSSLTVAGWIDGKTVPSGEELAAVETALGVSIRSEFSIYKEQ